MRVQNAVLGCNLKQDRMISVHFQGKPFNITVIQAYSQPVMLKKLKLIGSVKPYWRRKWQLPAVLLPGKFHGWSSLVGYSPWGHKESDTTEWLHFLSFYSSFWRRTWQPTPVFLPGESHGQRGLVGFSLWGCKESDTTKQLTHTHEALQDLLELTRKKDVLFIIGHLNAKVGSQEIPGVTGKFGLGVQIEAGQRLMEFYQENELVIANTLFQQHKTLRMDITRWSVLKSDWLFSLQPKMEKLYTVSKNKIGSWLWLSYHELFIAKFRLQLKKVGKTTGQSRYDLNQIPYNYTVEVTDSRD